VGNIYVTVPKSVHAQEISGTSGHESSTTMGAFDWKGRLPISVPGLDETVVEL